MGENLHSSTVAQVSSQFKALWESGKENATVKESSLKFTQRHVGDSKFSWKKVLQSDETKIKLFGHQNRRYDGEHQIQHSTPSPLWSIMVIVSCCRECFSRGQPDSVFTKTWEKVHFSARQWPKNIQRKLLRNNLKITRWMFWSGWVKLSQALI